MIGIKALTHVGGSLHIFDNQEFLNSRVKFHLGQTYYPDHAQLTYDNLRHKNPRILDRIFHTCSFFLWIVMVRYSTLYILMYIQEDINSLSIEDKSDGGMERIESASLITLFMWNKPFANSVYFSSFITSYFNDGIFTCLFA